MLSILNVFFIIVLLICPSSIARTPFVVVTSVNPEQPEVFEAVGISLLVVTKESIVQLEWDFGDFSYGATMLNVTGQQELVVFHVYTVPGNYYFIVQMDDFSNYTVRDVQPITVKRQQTTLTLNVFPPVVNTTNHERFILQSQLISRGSPVDNGTITFWCGNTNTTWLPIGTSNTDQMGSAQFVFNPPFEGKYDFQATYDGDQLYDSSTRQYVGAIVTPEFPFAQFLVVISLIVCIVILKRKSK